MYLHWGDNPSHKKPKEGKNMKFQALNNEIFNVINDMIEFDEILNSDNFSAPESMFDRNDELVEIDFSEESLMSLYEIC